jgi:hypothetical protein
MADVQDPKVEQLEEDSDDEEVPTTNNASAEDALEEVSRRSQLHTGSCTSCQFSQFSVTPMHFYAVNSPPNARE